MRKGIDTRNDVIQMMTIRMPVLCFVTRNRACSGYRMAMKRSQAIADSVRTLDVRQVTVFGQMFVHIEDGEREEDRQSDCARKRGANRREVNYAGIREDCTRMSLTSSLSSDSDHH